MHACMYVFMFGMCVWFVWYVCKYFMYVCMHVCMVVCMYAYTVCMVFMYVFLSVRIYVFHGMNVCIHACIYGIYLKTILLQFTYLSTKTEVSSLALTRNHNTTRISLENNLLQECDTKYDGGATYSDFMISEYVAYRWIPVKRSSWIKRYTTWVTAISVIAVQMAPMNIWIKWLIK